MTERTALRNAAAACCAAALLGACASNTTVVLLPERDGAKTSVSVQQGDREVVLDKPYAAVRESPFGPYPYTASAQEVEARFGPALAAQPPRPISFTLYFGTGQEELTPESKQVFEQAFA